MHENHTLPPRRRTMWALALGAATLALASIAPLGASARVGVKASTHRRSAHLVCVRTVHPPAPSRKSSRHGRPVPCVKPHAVRRGRLTVTPVDLGAGPATEPAGSSSAKA